jgi:hypothetical protein
MLGRMAQGNAESRKLKTESGKWKAESGMINHETPRRRNRYERLLHSAFRSPLPAFQPVGLEP